MAVYLGNCLVPRGNAIRLGEETRNKTQSTYQLKFTQGEVAASSTLPNFVGS